MSQNFIPNFIPGHKLSLLTFINSWRFDICLPAPQIVSGLLTNRHLKGNCNQVIVFCTQRFVINNGSEEKLRKFLLTDTVEKLVGPLWTHLGTGLTHSLTPVTRRISSVAHNFKTSTRCPHEIPPEVYFCLLSSPCSLSLPPLVSVEQQPGWSQWVNSETSAQSRTPSFGCWNRGGTCSQSTCASPCWWLEYLGAPCRWGAHRRTS